MMQQAPSLPDRTKRHGEKARVAVSAAAGFLTLAAAGHPPCRYEVTIIDGPRCSFGLDGVIRGFGVDGEGRIVGEYWCPLEPDETAYYWAGGPAFVTIEFPWATLTSTAEDINDSMEIAGSVTISGEGRRAFLRTERTVLNLGTLPGGNYSEASAITQHRIVVGRWGNNVTGKPTSGHGFLWSDGVMISIGDTLGTPSSSATDMNELGQITGWRGTAAVIDARGFLLDGCDVIDVGLMPGAFTTEPKAINNAGQIVGIARRDTGNGVITFHAFLWEEGAYTELPVGDGFTESRAIDVNDSGDSIGAWMGSGQPSTAVLWHEGEATVLNDLIPGALGVEIRSVGAINENGQIAGDGEFVASGENIALLLTPVYSPPTDLDGDCVTGFGDLLILLANWHERDSPADFDHDGTVGFSDLLILLAAWD